MFGALSSERLIPLGMFRLECLLALVRCLGHVKLHALILKTGVKVESIEKILEFTATEISY